MIIGCNYYFGCLWMAIALLEVHIGHTGHNVPGFNDSVRHDMHHFGNICNFGPIGICDWIYGTEHIEKKKEI